MYLFYVLLVFLTTYTDTPLTNYFGAFGFSALPVITFISFPCMYLFGRRLVYPKFSTFFFKLINYTLVLSFVAMLVFLVFGLPLSMYGDNAVAKSFKLYITFLSYIMFFIMMFNLMIRYNLKQVARPFFYVFIFLTVFGYIENTMIPNAFMQLHATHWDQYWRVRLLTQESSHTSPIITVFFLMALYYSMCVVRRKAFVAVTWLCLIIQLSISGSKLFMVIIMISGIVGAWSYIKAIRGWKRLAGIVAAIYVLTYMYDTIFSQALTSFQQDINESTSTATRITTNVSGYLFGTIIPIGTGFYSYLYILPNAFKLIIDYLPNNFDTTELLNYINAKDNSGLAAKSFFSQSTLYWGIIGSVMLFKRMRLLLKNFMAVSGNEERVVVKVLFIAVLIHLFISTNLDFVFISVFAFLASRFYVKTKLT